jgi:hypothetical protein
VSESNFQIDLFVFPNQFILRPVLEIGSASGSLLMVSVVTGRISLVRISLSFIWHSIKAYYLTLRQSGIEVDGFAPGFPVVRAAG